MIEATGVSLRYPDDTLALKSFNLHFETGEMVYVTGPSGAGKTSFLKLLMGIEYPTTGSLKVMGQPITEGQTAEIRQLRRIIGPVFQEFRLLKGRTAMDNVILGMSFLVAFPFLLEGLLLTVGGGILAVSLAAFVLNQVYAQMTGHLSFIPLLPAQTLISGMVVVVMSLSIILGIGGSLIGLTTARGK